MCYAALHALFTGKGPTTSLLAALTLKTAVLISISLAVFLIVKAAIAAAGSVKGARPAAVSAGNLVAPTVTVPASVCGISR